MDNSPQNITFTDEYKNAYELLEHSDAHVFLTGKAGTGKSTFLDYFRNNTEKNIAVVAPTGVAAINVKGQTIHSFFGFRPGFMDPDAPRHARKDLRKLYKAVDILVIDEISMVRADMMDAICTFLTLNGKDSGHPLGGVQLCLIGDLYQLPPVLTHHEKEAFHSYYSSPYFFEAKSFANIHFQFLELTQIFRQSDDAFIRFLNHLRENTLTPKMLNWFNAHHCKPDAEASDAIILTTTNRVADYNNLNKLDALSTPSHNYDGAAKGSFAKENEKLPAPLDLELKVGAHVMFSKNDKDKRWVNGTVGEVTKLADQKITVRVESDEYVVERQKWEAIRYEYDAKTEKMAEVVVGSYEQFPLQLAWAITIHKSQGKTFDNVVINLGNGAFTKGQAYVALSRCRTLNGVKLVCPLKASDIRVDEDIIRFMHQMSTQSPEPFQPSLDYKQHS